MITSVDGNANSGDLPAASLTNSTMTTLAVDAIIASTGALYGELMMQDTYVIETDGGTSTVSCNPLVGPVI